jgi:hypothetical protein
MTDQFRVAGAIRGRNQVAGNSANIIFLKAIYISLRKCETEDAVSAKN